MDSFNFSHKKKMDSKKWIRVLRCFGKCSQYDPDFNTRTKGAWLANDPHMPPGRGASGVAWKSKLEWGLLYWGPPSCTPPPLWAGGRAGGRVCELASGRADEWASARPILVGPGPVCQKIGRDWPGCRASTDGSQRGSQRRKIAETPQYCGLLCRWTYTTKPPPQLH